MSSSWTSFPVLLLASAVLVLLLASAVLEHGKTLVGVEDIGGDELRPRQVQAEFVDRTGQAEPVEHFMLTGIDDVAAGGGLARRVVAVDEQLIQPAIGGSVRGDVPRLVGQERVRPTGGCHQRHAKV